LERDFERIEEAAGQGLTPLAQAAPEYELVFRDNGPDVDREATARRRASPAAGERPTVRATSAAAVTMRTRVTGFVPPVATPFRDGRLDLVSFGRMLDDLAPHVQGVLVGGSVGESPSLDFDEKVKLMRAAPGQLGETHSLGFSISDNSMETSRRLSEIAGECGADLLMVLSPNYYGNDRAMLKAYFAAVSEFASADICLYDNPVASH